MWTKPNAASKSHSRNTSREVLAWTNENVVGFSVSQKGYMLLSGRFPNVTHPEATYLLGECQYAITSEEIHIVAHQGTVVLASTTSFYSLESCPSCFQELFFFAWYCILHALHKKNSKCSTKKHLCISRISAKKDATLADSMVVAQRNIQRDVRCSSNVCCGKSRRQWSSKLETVFWKTSVSAEHWVCLLWEL